MTTQTTAANRTANDFYTAKIRGGHTVLAKQDGTPLRFTNYKQASTQLGWLAREGVVSYVRGFRPFFVVILPN